MKPWLLAMLVTISVQVVAQSPRAGAGTARKADLGMKPAVAGPGASLLRSVRPKTKAEVEFIQAFGAEIGHALAVVARDPQVTYARGSLPERLREVHMRLATGQKRAAMQQRAAQRLGASTQERAKFFNDFADPIADSRLKEAVPGLSPTLKSKLQAAMKSRMSEDLQEHRRIFQQSATAQKLAQARRTWVQAGTFTKEFVTDGTNHLIIHAPALEQFRWWTTEPGAETAMWRLMLVGKNGNSAALIANGVAGDVLPGGKTMFSVDLGKWLPPSPPPGGALYVLEVQARKKVALSGPNQKPSMSVPELGPWSSPVVIHFTKDPNPPTKFPVETFTNARFHLDKLKLEKDQSGGGNEEFYITGFVSHVRSGAPSVSQGFGPYLAVLHPDGPREKKFGPQVSFDLQPYDSHRALIGVISLIEKDGGDDMGKWEESVWKIAEMLISPEISSFVTNYIKDNFEQHAAEWAQYGINAAAHAAEIAASIIGSTVGSVAGMAIAACALVIAAVVSGMADDYYGTEVFALIMPHSDVSYFYGAAGHFNAKGDFETKTESLSFLGEGSYPAATSTDGACSVDLHFEIRHRTWQW